MSSQYKANPHNLKIKIFKMEINAKIFLTGKITPLNVRKVKNNFTKNSTGSVIKKLGNTVRVD